MPEVRIPFKESFSVSYVATRLRLPNMTLQQELSSWNPFQKSQHEVKAVPEVGSPAPSTVDFKLPRNDQKPTIIVFLRHCGCPCNYFPLFFV